MSPLTRRVSSARARDEHGAVAVIVALLMVPLIGFAALAVDVASLWAQRQQLQTGADAAALAIASDCLRGSCGTATQTARDFAAANLRHGVPTATATATGNEVRVTNSAARSFVFAPALGVSSGSVTTEATAKWGSPTGGRPVLPVLLNYCEYSYQTGGGQPTGTTSRTVMMSQTSVSSCTASGFTSSYAPGGFAWSRLNQTSCVVPNGIGGDVPIANVTSPSSNGCTTSYVATLQNRTVLFPVFKSGRGDKNNASVTIFGYAPFKLTGYNLGSGYLWNSPCDINERCLRGYFTTITEPDATFTYGSGPALGGGFVTLAE
jgi:Flp pilus assembly protein TadG